MNLNSSRPLKSSSHRMLIAQTSRSDVMSSYYHVHDSIYSSALTKKRTRDWEIHSAPEISALGSSSSLRQDQDCASSCITALKRRRRDEAYSFTESKHNEYWEFKPHSKKRGRNVFFDLWNSTSPSTKETNVVDECHKLDDHTMQQLVVDMLQTRTTTQK